MKFKELDVKSYNLWIMLFNLKKLRNLTIFCIFFMIYDTLGLPLIFKKNRCCMAVVSSYCKILDSFPESAQYFFLVAKKIAQNKFAERK